MPPTIRDVAAAAGVSLGTVSKGLNGTGQLREETRERVHRAAKRLNFRPNHLAQSLLRGRSFTIGLISTDRYGRFSIPVLEGIEDALEDARVSVFLCNGADDPDREREHVEQLLAKRVDGIIVTARRTDPRARLKLPAHSVPVLYAFAQVRDAKALCLLPDDLGGGRLAGEHLIATGRRRIAHITGPEDFEAVRHRCAGLQAGARARRAAVARRPRRQRPVERDVGPRSGRAAHSHGNRSSTRSSAAAIRSPAAPWMRCAISAFACPTTSRWSASTTGRSSPPRHARR